MIVRKNRSLIHTFLPNGGYLPPGRGGERGEQQNSKSRYGRRHLIDGRAGFRIRIRIRNPDPDTGGQK